MKHLQVPHLPLLHPFVQLCGGLGWHVREPGSKCGLADPSISRQRGSPWCRWNTKDGGCGIMDMVTWNILHQATSFEFALHPRSCSPEVVRRILPSATLVIDLDCAKTAKTSASHSCLAWPWQYGKGTRILIWKTCYLPTARSDIPILICILLGLPSVYPQFLG